LDWSSVRRIHEAASKLTRNLYITHNKITHGKKNLDIRIYTVNLAYTTTYDKFTACKRGCILHRVRKKNIPDIFDCNLKKGLSDFNNFWHQYFWHNWRSNDCAIFQSLLSAFALPKEIKPTKYCILSHFACSSFPR